MKIKRSFGDVNINNCKQAIVNINLSKETPTTILVDVNKSFTEITKNDKLSLVAGVNYNDEKKIEISFLIAGKNYASDFDSAFDDNSAVANSWTVPTIKVESIDDSGTNEYDNLMKDVNEAAKPTEDVLNQNKPKDENIG